MITLAGITPGLLWFALFVFVLSAGGFLGVGGGGHGYWILSDILSPI